MIHEEDTDKAIDSFRNLLKVIKQLREPDGCPWDKQQTPLSMRRDLLEEVYEAIDAITDEDAAHCKEELGDVLLNTIMISYMYEQNGDFKLSEEMDELAEKLIRRHPHVFPQSSGISEMNGNITNADEVLNQWDKIKQNVEGRKTQCILDEVPENFPPLLKACKYQKKAAKLGFEWNEIKAVISKVKEELAEVEEAIETLTHLQDGKENCTPFTTNSNKEIDEAQKHVEEEIGDLLFAVVNYARKTGVDPEIAMNRANDKFYRRFSYIQNKMNENNIPMDKNHIDIEEKYWNEAKENEKHINQYK